MPSSMTSSCFMPSSIPNTFFLFAEILTDQADGGFVLLANSPAIILDFNPMAPIKARLLPGKLQKLSPQNPELP